MDKIRNCCCEAKFSLPKTPGSAMHTVSVVLDIGVNYFF